MDDKKIVLAKFFGTLSEARMSVLLLDYDGTLAPFRTDRMRASPYSGVVPLLEEIVAIPGTRVALISGRPAAEVKGLLGPVREIEIWGSHGLELLLGDGTYRKTDITDHAAGLLSEARTRVVAEGLEPRAEFKPGGIAIHWRGLPNAEARQLETKVRAIWTPLPAHAELKLLSFDAGIEIRISHPDKGDAVGAILETTDSNASVACLGDDFTDEDAFRTVNGRGLTVLVRPKYRPTDAQVWLRPPDELLGFLREWRNRLTRQSAIG